jgi:hypothetical protein
LKEGKEEKKKRGEEETWKSTLADLGEAVDRSGR